MDDLAAIRRPPQYERILQRSRDAAFTMNSDVLTGSLLRTLAAARPAASLLELGTGCGLGTCWLLDGMDAESSLVSIDSDARVQSIASSELGTDPRLSLVLEDGGAFLERCHRRFDLIYADAYPGKLTHFDQAIGLLNRGGIYIVDDMDPQPQWPDGHAPKARALVERLEQLPGFEVTKLTWSTGLILAVKR
jgi:predicted O-methyltransferase YrrM